MATVGQVVYNLRSFHASADLTSTKDDKTGTTSSNQPNYENERIKIFGEKNDLVSKFIQGGSFSKLGIQAPPGTKFKLNSTKDMIIGRTGVYELDEDIKITALWFEQPKKYILDVPATQASLTAGMEGFDDAEEQRKSEIASLNTSYIGKEKDAAYWAEYTRIHEDYEKLYAAAEPQYIAGVNGIYKLPNPSNLESEENYEELYDVIIDFLY